MLRLHYDGLPPSVDGGVYSGRWRVGPLEVLRLATVAVVVVVRRGWLTGIGVVTVVASRQLMMMLLLLLMMMMLLLVLVLLVVCLVIEGMQQLRRKWLLLHMIRVVLLLMVATVVVVTVTLEMLMQLMRKAVGLRHDVVTIFRVNHHHLVGVVIQIAAISGSATIADRSNSGIATTLYRLCCPAFRYSRSFMRLRCRGVVFGQVAATRAEVPYVDRRRSVGGSHGTCQMPGERHIGVRCRCEMPG